MQGALEAALERITGRTTRVVGAGRTDSGVHATAQVAHFDSSWSQPAADLLRACNAVLAWDVALHMLDVVPGTFHARHDADSRTYHYRLWRGAIRSPLRRLQSWHVPGDLDVAAMESCAAAMVGSHDFAALGRPMTPEGPTVRRVDACTVRCRDDELAVSITANAFLRHQVRRTVGLLVAAGRGQVEERDVVRMLRTGRADTPVRRAPAQGLTLVAVRYAEDEYSPHRMGGAVEEQKDGMVRSPTGTETGEVDREAEDLDTEGRGG